MTHENIELALQYALDTEPSDKLNSELPERIANSLVVADSMAENLYNESDQDRAMALWKEIGTIQRDFKQLEDIISTFYEMLQGNIVDDIDDPKKLGAMIREYAGKELA